MLQELVELERNDSESDRPPNVFGFICLPVGRASSCLDEGLDEGRDDQLATSGSCYTPSLFDTLLTSSWTRFLLQYLCFGDLAREDSPQLIDWAAGRISGSAEDAATDWGYQA